MTNENANEKDEIIERDSWKTASRRSCLRATGLALVGGVATASQSGVASASTGGYGDGGYGHGGYGDGTTLAASSGDATDVGPAAATVTGSVTDLGGASSVTASCKWRRADRTGWNEAGEQTLSSTGSFAVTLSSLDAATTYEYRAFVTDGDGTVATGAVRQFTTTTANVAPTVESFVVSEAGSPNPHVEVSAGWTVADTDRNLDTVVVEVTHESGALADASMTDVSGAVASGTETIGVKHVDGETLDVTLTVVDTYGVSASRTTTVTE